MYWPSNVRPTDAEENAYYEQKYPQKEKMADRFTSPEIDAAVAGIFKGRKAARFLVLPDMHIPQHDVPAVNAVMTYALHEKQNGVPFNGWIQIGDFQNFKGLSKHSEFDKIGLEGARVRKDTDAGNAFLDRIQSIIPDNGFLLEGNHDERLARWIKANPQFAGLGITVPELLRLDDRNIIWVPNWSEGKVLRIGKVVFVHGSIIRKHHAAGMMDKFQTCVVYGHAHDEQLFSAVSAADDNVRVAHCIGCLQDRRDYWEQFNGNRWQTAFADFTFFKDGGFSYVVHKIVDNRFSAGGRVFGPKGLIR